MRIEVEIPALYPTRLEEHRPAGDCEWHLVLSGWWSESPDHSGHVEYFLAFVSKGVWVLDCVRRLALLDDVTQEDVEERRLTLDQSQALHNMTLEEAKNEQWCHIAAVAFDVPARVDEAALARVLYDAVVIAGGYVVEEPGGGGLLQ